MNNKEKKDKSIAIAGTLFVHALVVLFLFLMAFRTPLPLPGEEGVEVDLGMMDQGVGNIQPEKPAVPQSYSPPKETQKAEDDLVTQNDDEAPAIEKPKKIKPKQEKLVEEPKPVVNQRALFKGNNNPQSNGSEGVTGQSGDQGKPNGLAGIKQYEGQGGKGNGSGYDLGGRGAKSLYRPSNDFVEEGIIVVDIWVDRNGKVVRAEIAPKGTTLIDREMREKAKQAAMRSSFVADPDAPDEQHGIITYTFVINQ